MKDSKAGEIVHSDKAMEDCGSVLLCRLAQTFQVFDTAHNLKSLPLSIARLSDSIITCCSLTYTHSVGQPHFGDTARYRHLAGWLQAMA